MPLTRAAAENQEPVAYSVEINYMTCIVFAVTPAKARWIAVKNYWEAGYGRGRGTWPNPVARREPRFDRSPRRNEGPRAWSEQYL